MLETTYIENKTKYFALHDKVRNKILNSDSELYMKYRMKEYEKRIAFELAYRTQSIFTNNYSIKLYLPYSDSRVLNGMKYLHVASIPLDSMMYGCNAYFCTLTYNDKYLPRFKSVDSIKDITLITPETEKELRDRDNHCFLSDDLVRFTRGIKDEFQRSRKRDLYKENEEGQLKYSEMVKRVENHFNDNPNLLDECIKKIDDFVSLPGNKEYCESIPVSMHDLVFDEFQFFNRPFNEINYIIVSEFGEKKSRSHYHIILTAPNIFDSLTIHKMFRKHWSVSLTELKKGKEIIKRWKKDGFHKDSFTGEIIDHKCGDAVREMLGMIRPSVSENKGNPATGKKPFQLQIDNIMKCSKYVAKYVTKGTAYNKQSMYKPLKNSLLHINSRDKEDKEIEGLGYKSTPIGAYYKDTKTVKFYDGSATSSSAIWHCRVVENRKSTNFINKGIVRNAIQKRDMRKSRCQVKMSNGYGSAVEQVITQCLEDPFCTLPTWFTKTFDVTTNKIFDGFKYKACQSPTYQSFPLYSMGRLMYKNTMKHREINSQIKLNTLGEKKIADYSLLDTFDNEKVKRIKRPKLFQKYKYKYVLVPNEICKQYLEYTLDNKIERKKEIINKFLINNQNPNFDNMVRWYVKPTDPCYEEKINAIKLYCNNPKRYTAEFVERAIYYGIGLRGRLLPEYMLIRFNAMYSSSYGVKDFSQTRAKIGKPQNTILTDFAKDNLAKNRKITGGVDYGHFSYHWKTEIDVNGEEKATLLNKYELKNYFSPVSYPSYVYKQDGGICFCIDFNNRHSNNPFFQNYCDCLESVGSLGWYENNLASIKRFAVENYMAKSWFVRPTEYDEELNVKMSCPSYKYVSECKLTYDSYFFAEEMFLTLIDMYQDYESYNSYKLQMTKYDNVQRSRAIFKNYGVDYKNFNQIV